MDSKSSAARTKAKIDGDSLEHHICSDINSASKNWSQLSSLKLTDQQEWNTSSNTLRSACLLLRVLQSAILMLLSTTESRNVRRRGRPSFHSFNTSSYGYRLFPRSTGQVHEGEYSRRRSRRTWPYNPKSRGKENWVSTIYPTLSWLNDPLSDLLVGWVPVDNKNIYFDPKPALVGPCQEWCQSCILYRKSWERWWWFYRWCFERRRRLFPLRNCPRNWVWNTGDFK